MSIIVVGPEDGEQAGGGPIRCRIIEDGSHTEHRLGLIEVIVPPEVKRRRPLVTMKISSNLW